MIEQHLDNAIRKVKSGEQISAVVSSYPTEVQTELKSMLEIITLVQTLPVKSVPTPNRRKLWLDYQPVSRWQSITRSFRLVPAVLASLVLVIAGTAFGAQASLPGDKLFTVKKTYESLQVKLAATPEKRAKLQLEFAAQRFQEAQKVLATTDNDASKKAAIEELNQQTAIALNDIKQSAVSISASNPGLVQKAEEITTSQSNLVAKADPKVADTSAVQKTKESKATLHDIKKIIAAANEETGATIVPDSSIDITGPINSIKDNVININKIEFVADNNTEVYDSDDNAIKLTDLAANIVVKIEAEIQDSKNVAKTITEIEKASTADKTDKVEKDGPKDNSKEKPKETKVEKDKPAKKQVVEDKTDAEQQDSVPETTLPADPKDTFGGFIPEPPIEFPGVSQ